MLSSCDLTAPPLYLERAPPLEVATQIEHLSGFRDTGVPSRRGNGRFASYS